MEMTWQEWKMTAAGMKLDLGQNVSVGSRHGCLKKSRLEQNLLQHHTIQILVPIPPISKGLICPTLMTCISITIVWDYDLICKKNPKMGSSFSSMRSECPFICLIVFLVIQTCGKIWHEALEKKFWSFICLEEEEGGEEIPVVVFGRGHNPAAMPLSPPTDNGIDYDNKGGSSCNKRGRWVMTTCNESGGWAMPRAEDITTPQDFVSRWHKHEICHCIALPDIDDCLIAGKNTSRRMTE